MTYPNALAGIEGALAAPRVRAVLEALLVVVAFLGILTLAAHLIDVFHKPPVEVLAPSALTAAEPTVVQPIAVVTFPQAKKHLPLPAAVKASPTQQVIAASDIKEQEGKRSVSAVIDTSTGKTELYVSPIDRPWLGFDKRGGVGVFLGLNTHLEPTVRVQAQQDFMRLGDVRLGVNASADITRAGVTGFVGIGARVEW